MPQRKKKSPESALFNGFSGIDTRLFNSGKAGSADIVNFRITDSGALKKRCGFRRYAEFGSNIRAVWTGVINEKEVCVLLCGDEMLILNGTSETPSFLGKIDSTIGKACFFYYRDRLYLMDGKKIYELIPPSLTLSEAIGYIPLIGKDWQTGVRGEIYEKRNLLCDKARISYKIEAYPTIYLNVCWPAKTIDAVYLNGAIVAPSSYTYNTIFNTVDMKGLKEGDEVLIYVTYESPEDTELSQGLFTCSAAMNFGALGKDRIFAWNGIKKNTLYCSESVSRESMNASLAIDPKTSPLYFPIGYEFTAGDGRHAIRAAIRHYDRLLVFTECDAWNASFEVNGLKDNPLSSINSGAGCISECAVGMAENSPVSVGKRTIFAWNANTDEFNECNATSISVAIDALLPKSFYENAVVFNADKYGELWFHSKSDHDTWIYNIKKQVWYRFSGFEANGFFEFCNNVFFYDKATLFCFVDTLKSDLPSTEKENLIQASFTSTILEFDIAEKKRLDSFILHSDMNGGKIEVSIYTDTLSPVSFTVQEKQSDHSIFDKRLHSGRFKYATLTLSSSDIAQPTIHSSELFARE